MSTDERDAEKTKQEAAADMSIDPGFHYMIRASGLAEVWTDDGDKLKQFGWRSTTKESSYGSDVLIGNWNEGKFDLEQMRQPKELPSQNAHYFDTTYDKSYNRPRQSVPSDLLYMKGREPFAFPAHQPELDPTKVKKIYNSFETTSRAAYKNPYKIVDAAMCGKSS